MTKKMYTFNIQAQITLDDREEPNFYYLPKNLSQETKKRITALFKECIDTSDIIYGDEMADTIEVPVFSINFCLE